LNAPSYPRIIDDSLSATFTNPDIAAVTGGGLRGPLGPNLVTTYQQLILQYGFPNPEWGFMLDASQAFLLQGTSIYLNRVVAGDAMYGLGLISNNWTGGGVGETPLGTSFTTIPGGSSVPYTDVNLDIIDIEIDGQFVVGSAITVTINTISQTVNFNTNHNTTMQAIQQAIITIIDSFGPGGFCDLPVTNSSTYQTLRIISPNAITLDVTASVTGSGAPAFFVYPSDWLAIVVANNPGSWSSPGGTAGGPGVAVGITNIDTGTNERVTVSLSSPITSGQTLSMTINTQTISVAFSQSNDQTLTDFCTAFASAFPLGTASVVNSGGEFNLQFVLVAPNSTTELDVTVQQVTGTGNTPIVSSAVTLTNVPSTGQFDLVVYENAFFTAADETYLVTFENGTDGLGNPTGLDYVINGIPGATGNTSPRINVVVNPMFSGQVNGPTNVTLSVNALGLPNERFLGGGEDGSIPGTQQVVAGWSDFNNPETITIRLMIMAGYTDPAVAQELISIASSRMDCFAIMDIPSDSQDVMDAVNFRNNQMDISSFWGAVYSPDILIYDANMGVRRYVPPSGIVAGQYAFNDSVDEVWSSPAGLNRGVITQALGARFIYEEGDRDNLSQAQINAIRKYNAVWTIWGEYTLQQQMSALQSVGVVRLMITVMTSAASAVAFSVFEPDNPFTWNNVTAQLNALLDPIAQAGGINGGNGVGYLVQCNSTNNTPDIVDERVMLVAMWIKPTLSALYIQLDGIVTTQSAIFSVEEANANNAL
jgi:Phage tail sheath protein subtilisin-like domain